MKGSSLSVLGIFAAVVGAILILCFNSIKIAGVIIVGGILFVGVGLVNLIFYTSLSRQENGLSKILTLITNAASIVLGLSMLVFQSVFVPLVTFMFGLFVAVCALWQFFVLAVGARPYQLPAWMYVFPILLVVGAVYIFMHKHTDGEHLIILGTGISMAVLGLGCIIEGSALGMARRSDRKNQEAQQAQQQAQQAPPAQPTPNTNPVQPASSSTVSPVHVDTMDVAPLHPATAPKPIKAPIETTEDLDDEIKDPSENQ